MAQIYNTGKQVLPHAERWDEVSINLQPSFRSFCISPESSRSSIEAVFPAATKRFWMTEYYLQH